MNAIITMPDSIPVAFHNTEIPQLRRLLSFPEFAGHAQAMLDFRMVNEAVLKAQEQADKLAKKLAEKALAKALADASSKLLQQAFIENGAVLETMGGAHFSYLEILQMATIRKGKQHYDMPEDNIVNRLQEEIAGLLKGVQSLNDQELKQAMGNLA